MEDVFEKMFGKSREEKILEWSRSSVKSSRYYYEKAWFMDECPMKKNRLIYARRKMSDAVSQYIEDYYNYLQTQD